MIKKRIPTKNNIFGWYIWHQIKFTSKVTPSDCTRWTIVFHSQTIEYWNKFLSDLYPDYGNIFHVSKDNDSLRMERNSTGGSIRGLKTALRSPNDSSDGRRVKQDKSVSRSAKTGTRRKPM